MAAYRRISYFELNAPPAKVNWSIRDEPASLAAFASLKGAVEPPPPGGCDEIIAERDTALALVQVANETITTLTLERDALQTRITNAQAALG